MKDLKELNPVIQVCPTCRRVDVYKNDGHDCGQHLANQDAREHYQDK